MRGRVLEIGWQECDTREALETAYLAERDGGQPRALGLALPMRCGAASTRTRRWPRSSGTGRRATAKQVSGRWGCCRLSYPRTARS